jgi:hypothetical protein
VIDWISFFVVLAASIAAACGVVALYSFGLRLVDGAVGIRRAAGVACFVLCALLIVYGVYLVIPLFHR